MPHLSQAWDDLIPNLVAWVVVMIALLVVTVLTCGMGIILLPNLLRVAKHSLEHGEAPRVADLFDLSDFVEHLLLLLLSVFAGIVASFVPLVGTLVAATLLVWAAPLVVDGHYGTIEATQLSIRAVTQNIVPVAIFQLIVMVITMVSSLFCLMPLLLTAPLCVLATWHYYMVERDGLLALGDEAGLRRRA